MKTKKTNGRTNIATLVILSLVSLIACVVLQFIPGKDYTANYKAYSDVKDITGTYELMDYCHTKGIQYSINNNVFKLEGYTIMFSLNKSECSIKNDNHLNYLWLLENGRYDTVATKKLDDGSTVKSYMLKTLGTNYENCNGTYTVYNMWPALIALFVTIAFATILVKRIFCPVRGSYQHNEPQE